MEEDKNRTYWLTCADEEMLKACTVQHYKASGPGGQHRNKVSSAVRLVHNCYNLMVTSAESRHQHENRKYALRKLRTEIALNVREHSAKEKRVVQEFADLSPRNRNYAFHLALVIDILDQFSYELRLSAESMGLSASRLAKLLYRDATVWQFVNLQRQKQNLPPLRKP